MTLSRLSIGRLRGRGWAILLAVLSLLGAGVWYLYAYRPARQEIAALEEEIERLDLRILRGEAARDALPDLRRTVAELEAERVAFLEQLPTESEVADLLDQLRDTAAETGVLIGSISRGGSSEDVPDVRAIDFSLAGEGSFARTMTFLARLENLERFTRIEQVSLSTSEAADDPTLTADVGFTVFVFTGEDPGAPEAGP